VYTSKKRFGAPRNSSSILVEVAANAEPLLVRIVDHGKFEFKHDKRARDARSTSTCLN
jgi:translation initiation factor IF-3